MFVELEAILKQALPGARVSVAPVDRRAVARDLWPRRLIELAEAPPVANGPAAVVWPESVDDVVQLVRTARAHGIGLVPFGAGSGVCAGIAPAEREVVVDLKRLRSHRVLPGPELDVEAGALGITLEEDLLRAGYTTGHYPSSILISTAGGWVAARGAGQCSGRYGKIEDMVTWVELVLGTGERVLARRRENGPNLLPLIVGSEGTLGIITRVGLRLHPAPSERRFLAFAFQGVDQGMRALRELYQSGQRPAVARLYDPLDTWLMKQEDGVRAEPRPPHSGINLKGDALRALLRRPFLAAQAMAAVERTLYSRAALVLVLEGDQAAELDEDARRIDVACRALGGASLGEGPARAWYRYRYHVSYRQPPLFRSGSFVDTMEVAAPWSCLPAVYREVRRALSPHVLVMAHFSHSYPDGASIYFTFAGTEHAGESAQAIYDRAWREALSAALAAGATLSHHHGVGRSKAARLTEELGSAVGVVRALKTAWDPDQLLNPGALLPPPSDAEQRDAAAPVTTPLLDVESALVELPASWRLNEAEAWLAARGRTLRVTPEALAAHGERSVNDWLGAGMPGLPDGLSDPVAPRLAGLTATLPNGRRFRQRGAPRRAVGPDLSSLFLGLAGEFGRVEAVTLPAPPSTAPSARPLPFSGERNPRMEADEAGAWAALSAAFGAR